MDVLVTEDCTVEAQVGAVLRLHLPENATTGYLWTLADLGEGLRTESERSVAGGVAPGAAGLHEVVLRVEQPGTWPVLLRLGRSWEAEASQERRVVVEAR